MEVELTTKQKENNRKDSIVLDNLSTITVLSEAILQSMTAIQSSGSVLYRHKFKQNTKRYRKDVVGLLNNYYDVMESGGVGDAFILQMKQDSSLHSAISGLSFNHKKKVAMFISDMLENPEKPIEVEDVNVSNTDPDTIPNQVDPEHTEEKEMTLTKEQKEMMDLMGIDSDKVEEAVTKQEEVAEVKEQGEELNDEQKDFKDLMDSIESKAVAEAAGISQDEAKKALEGQSPIIPQHLNFEVNPEEYTAIMKEEQSIDKTEQEVLTAVINRLSHRKGIDVEFYQFVGTNKEPNENGDLIFNFQLKL